MISSVYEELVKAIGIFSILPDEPMSNHTSFRIGGPADYVVLATEPEEIAAVQDIARRAGVPFRVLGNGSNVLVSDEGLRGITVLIRDTQAPVSIDMSTEPAHIEVGAGCPLTRLALEASRAGLTGLEFASGIPGTVGGAVVMNAGAYGGELKDCITGIDAVDPKGDPVTLSADELELGYRHSCIEERGLIVLRARFELSKGEPEQIEARLKELSTARKDKQPLEYPSAGSTFKRPEGYFAGKLIQDAGLKGFRVGDAQVSEKHCGFVINLGHATAAEVRDLIEQVSDKVFASFGVRLEPEVRLLGFDASEV